MDIQEAKKKLEDLSKELEKIEASRNKRINVFEAAGLISQEVKHSAFLAWLIDPSKPHGLGTRVCAELMKRIVEYDSSAEQAVPNREILKDKISVLHDFCADESMKVETEKVLVNKESRMDIYIESVKTQTVLVIENKVFTSTHDDQLLKYEEELKVHDGWNKILIYLTRFGELPININGEYNDKWCILDYRTVLQAIDGVVSQFGKTDKKLKILTEDYKEIVETNILGENKEIRNLCRQIMRKHAYAVELLKKYTDNAEEVIAHCKSHLKKNYEDIIIFKESKLSFDFYTKTVKEYFEHFGEEFNNNNKLIKCKHGLGGYDGPIGGAYSLYKNPDDEWSFAQKKIMSVMAPDKKQGNKYFSFNNVTLLGEDEREKPFNDELKSELNDKLDRLVLKLKEFDLKLKDLY